MERSSKGFLATVIGLRGVLQMNRITGTTCMLVSIFLVYISSNNAHLLVIYRL